MHRAVKTAFWFIQSDKLIFGYNVEIIQYCMRCLDCTLHRNRFIYMYKYEIDLLSNSYVCVKEAACVASLCWNCQFVILAYFLVVALAVRLDLCFRSVYFFIREYLPNRWTYLNKSLHGDGNWLVIEYGGFEFLNFWGGLGWGPKMSLFARICPEWPSQNTICRQNGERYQKSKTVFFWPDNFTT